MIDAYKALVRNALKKTGDAMISGWLTLFADPTDAMHATTKQYVDGLVATSTVGAALTRSNDTNVTLSLGGTPTTALLHAASLTLGWAGQLAISRGGTGQATASAAFDALSPLSARGDLVIRNATTNTRLAIGAAGRFLQSDGSDPSWVALSGDATIAAGGALTLAASGVAAATYGSATQSAVITVDAKGRITAASNLTIAGASGVLGAIQYSDGAGAFTSDDTNFHWDDGSVRLGLATNNPQYRLDCRGPGNFDGAVKPHQDATWALGTISARWSDIFVQALNSVSLGTLSATSGRIIVGDGSALQSVAVSGDAALASTGALTLASLLTAGGPTGSATVAPIITWDAKGRLTAVSSATITPAASSITGGAALTKSDDTNVTLLLGGSPTTALLTAASLTLGWSGQLAISRGGTGQATASAAFDALSPVSTRGDLIYRNATTNARLGIGSSARFLQSDGTDPAWVAMSGDATIAAGGAITLASTITAGGPTGSATVAPIITYDAKGRLTTVSSATITPAASSITGGAALTKSDDTNVTLALGGSASSALLAAASLTLGWTGTLAAARLNANVVQAITNDTNITGSIATQTLTLGWTGTLSVARGGIGVGTLAAHGVLIGEGTSAVAATAVGTAGQLLIGQGASADPSFNSVSGDAALTSAGVVTVREFRQKFLLMGG